LPECAGLLGIVCSPDYKAIDHGTQCAHTQQILQGAMTKEAEWPTINAGCRGSRMAANQVISEKRRADVLAKPKP
jgi:hypothetical protein